MSHSSLQSADSRAGFKTVSKNLLNKLHYFAAIISLKHTATAVTGWSLKPLTRKRTIKNGMHSKGEMLKHFKEG